jgi:hypothetical protein
MVSTPALFSGGASSDLGLDTGYINLHFSQPLKENSEITDSIRQQLFFHIIGNSLIINYLIIPFYIVSAIDNAIKQIIHV